MVEAVLEIAVRRGADLFLIRNQEERKRRIARALTPASPSSERRRTWQQSAA